MAVFWSVLALIASTLLTPGQVYAQDYSAAKEIPSRLKRGVENSDSAKSEYRPGSPTGVLQNMNKIAGKTWMPGDTMVKFMAPHLRDLLFEGPADRTMRTKGSERQAQAWFRARAKARRYQICLDGTIACINGLNESLAACPLCQNSSCGRNWPHQEHLDWACCPSDGKGSEIYEQLIYDSNFKTCCVRDGNSRDKPYDRSKDETKWTEEKIACSHPKGDGWAGLFEFYYPVTVVGLENQQGETMLATQQEVEQQLNILNDLKADGKRADWVAGAIERLAKYAAGPGAQQQQGANQADIKQVIQEVQQELGRMDPKLRHSDSIRGLGLTARTFAPGADDTKKGAITKDLCVHPGQFHKIWHEFGNLKHDKLLQPGFGGITAQELLNKNKFFASWSAEGYELMTNPENSRINNFHFTRTNYVRGMQAWDQNHLFCQAKLAETDQNMKITGLDQVIKLSGWSQSFSPAATGFTCLGHNLNLAHVPLMLYRQAYVDRRAAIGDLALPFATAAGLYPSKWVNPGLLTSRQRAFEQQPYTMYAEPGLQMFWGKAFNPAPMLPVGVKNELNQPCRPLNGPNYQRGTGYTQGGNSDQIYTSDFTHKSFNQEPVLNIDNETTAFAKYSQEWAKNEEDQKKGMRFKGLDDKANNYFVAYRPMALCPLGFARWTPSDPHGLLKKRLEDNCLNENFGSPRQVKGPLGTR